MNLVDVDPHTIAMWFAIGCVQDQDRFKELLPYVTEERVPEFSLLETQWPDMVRGIGTFTHERVVRYWCQTHLCGREKTPIMVGVVINPHVGVPGFVQVKTVQGRMVRCTPYHNPRNLPLSPNAKVLVHGHTIAMTMEELCAWEAGH